MLDQKELTHQRFSITSALRVEGWRHLDAVILAALATRSPVLLIGSHGTAKTLLVERISHRLGLSFRHYNASLINYDDLVGIPMPEEGSENLHFVTTPGAIWDAQFVFFDEISRCRPDLQNKLFPIIHERRVVGLDLKELQHRWAAMNPPSPDEPDLDAPTNSYYLGSEPLDPALIDRFPYIVPVPDWRDLSPEDRRRIIDLHDESEDQLEPFGLADMVEECTYLIKQVREEYVDQITDYVMCVMDLLDKASLPQSPRRARTLGRTIVAVHAARLLLEGQDAALDESTETALLYGIPQNATEAPPTPAMIVATHRQAWEIVSKLDDDAWRQVLEEADPIRRVVLAEELGFDDEDMSQLVTQALNIDYPEPRMMGLATAMFLAFRQHRRLTPAAWEPLAKLSERVLRPGFGRISISNGTADANVWSEIEPWVLKRRERGGTGELEANFVLGGFPDMWRDYNWNEELNHFVEMLKLFGITGE